MDVFIEPKETMNQRQLNWKQKNQDPFKLHRYICLMDMIFLPPEDFADISLSYDLQENLN